MFKSYTGGPLNLGSLLRVLLKKVIPNLESYPHTAQTAKQRKHQGLKLSMGAPPPPSPEALPNPKP